MPEDSTSTPVLDLKNSKKKNLLFIVNPISHGLKGRNIESLIKSKLDTAKFDYQIAFTQYQNHASELTKEALKQENDAIIAVGGDGTVNEVGKALIHTQIPLGIVPIGSGNGLARHLNIPIDLIESIQTLNHTQQIFIDTGKINDKVFLGIAGVGFDAHIAWEFAQLGRRGFSSYLLTALREFPKYNAQTYKMIVDGKEFNKTAFILSFANSSQYGNDFIIAPEAKLQDGFLDLVIVKQLPFYSIQPFIFKATNGTLHKSQFVEIIRAKEIEIKLPEIHAHIDGEPVIFKDKIHVSIDPQSLRVLIPGL